MRTFLLRTTLLMLMPVLLLPGLAWAQRYPTTHLQAYYKFNAASWQADSAQNRHNIITTGPVTSQADAFGVAGNAVQLSQSGYNVSRGDSLANNTIFNDSAFTIVASVSPATTSGMYSTILEAGESFYLRREANNLVVGWYTGTAFVDANLGPLPLNQYSLIALEIKRAGARMQIKCWLNGNIFHQNSLAYPIARLSSVAQAALVIAGGTNGGVINAAKTWNGTFDELALYSSTVFERNMGQFDQLERNGVFFYRFNNTTTNFFPQSFNLSVAKASGSTPDPAFTSGVNAQSLRVNNNGYVSGQFPALRPAGSFSIGAWLNIPQFVSQATFGTVVELGEGIFIRINSSRQAEIGFPVGASGFYIAQSSSLLFDNWEHIVFTYDHTTREVAFYRNGVRTSGTAQFAYAPNRLLANYATFGVGTNGGNPNWTLKPFRGLIDDVFLYDRVLAHYAVNFMRQFVPITPPSAFVNISVQPVERVGCANRRDSLSVSVNNSQRVQWFKGTTPVSNSANISGATSTTLRFASVAAADTGLYFCRAYGATGDSVNSATARVRIFAAPTIRFDGIRDTTICPTIPIFLNFLFTREANPVTFTWFRDDVRIEGPTIIQTPIQVLGTGGVFYCVITDACGQTDTTDRIRVTVRNVPVPNITAVQEICFGTDSVRMVADITFEPGTSYSWYRGPSTTGPVLSTNRILVLPNATATSGLYTVRIVHPCQSFTIAHTVRVRQNPAMNLSFSGLTLKIPNYALLVLGSQYDLDVFNCVTNNSVIPSRSFQGDTVLLTVPNPGIYRVRSRSANFGCVDTTNCVTLTTPTGLAARVNRGSALFPNPAQEQVQVRLPYEGAKELLLTDIRGVVVRRQSTVELEETLSLQGLPSGLYTLRILTASGMEVLPLVVQP